MSSKKLVKNSDNYLLIVESPSKCSKIETYLGEKYKCISSKGHIREIDGLSSVNTKDCFQIEYTIIKEKKDHIDAMRKTVAKYNPDNILLATDDDREGEAIAWHICQVCGLDVYRTKRIVFHEITQPALLVAVADPIRINLSLVAAQQARQVLDLIVGFKLSPLLWRNLGSNRKNALSAGRCQTPALRLIFDHYQRYKELRDVGMTQIYKVSGLFTNKSIKFDLDGDIKSEESLLDFMDRTKTHRHILSVGKMRPSTRSPPRPFNTSKLLQTASNLFRFSPKTTMSLCQTLYQSGLITYMRTECQKYSDVFLKKASEYIVGEYGDSYVGDLDGITLLDTTMPHEGIRVTNISLRAMTSNDSMLVRMYGLIWRNTVESCMSTAKYNMTDYFITSPIEGVSYKYTMETPIFLGWRRLEIKDADISTEIQAVCSSTELYLGQIALSTSPVTWSLIESKVTVESKLPLHYTEASLIQKLEDLGIGRPSTFSFIVETIQDRGYAKKMDVVGIKQNCVEYKLRGFSQSVLEKNEIAKSFGDEKDKMVIQPTGILVLEFLLSHFADCFSYDYTKHMEDELDALSSLPSEQALASWHNICRKCYNDITDRSKPLAKQSKQAFSLADTADHVLIFNTYGASIKSICGTDSKPTYIRVRPDIELELEKAKRCEYTMAELIWRDDNGCLGEYNGDRVYLKKGKFGLYAEWGESKQTISMKSLNKPANEILLEDVLELIHNKNAALEVSSWVVGDGVYSNNDLVDTSIKGYGFAAAKPPPQTSYAEDKSILRVLRPDLSIRKGKYGPYIFHKTAKMTKPAFHPIKPIKDGWESMENLELIAAIENTYRLTM
jgi:DNA topoisomerase-1